MKGFAGYPLTMTAVIGEVRNAVLTQIIKALGEAVRPALTSWSQTARLAFLMIAAATAAVIYARYK